MQGPNLTKSVWGQCGTYFHLLGAIFPKQSRLVVLGWYSKTGQNANIQLGWILSPGSGEVHSSKTELRVQLTYAFSIFFISWISQELCFHRRKPHAQISPLTAASTAHLEDYLIVFVGKFLSKAGIYCGPESSGINRKRKIHNELEYFGITEKKVSARPMKTLKWEQTETKRK